MTLADQATNSEEEDVEEDEDKDKVNKLNRVDKDKNIKHCQRHNGPRVLSP